MRSATRAAARNTSVADDTLTERVGVYVELHVEQGRALEDLGRPVGRGLVDLAARQMALHLQR